jgi:hypothetical protein
MKRVDLMRLAIGAGGAGLAAYLMQRGRNRSTRDSLAAAAARAAQSALQGANPADFFTEHARIAAARIAHQFEQGHISLDQHSSPPPAPVVTRTIRDAEFTIIEDEE